jgi:hypothetical protein
MFCPLCRAEYRDGFTECGDCHVGLVGSAEEARLASVRLWKGNRQRTLDKILASIDAEGIPSHFEEIVNAAPQVTIFGIPLRPVKSTFEYEVWVLHTDIEKARLAIDRSRMTVSRENNAITCLDDVPNLASLAARQKFLSKWYAALATGPLGVFVPIEIVFDPKASSRKLAALILVSLIWAVVVISYTFYLSLAIHCPACEHRYGSGETCRSCNLPRHRNSSDISAVNS